MVVYTDKAKSYVSVPQTVNGLRTQVIATDAATLARNAAPAAPATPDGIDLSPNILAGAAAVEQEYAPRLLKDPSLFGVGVAQSLDNPQDPALLVLVDPDIAPRAMPATIGGLRVRYMKLHRFHVTRSKYADLHAAPSCALKNMTGARISDRGRLGP